MICCKHERRRTAISLQVDVDSVRAKEHRDDISVACKE